MKRTIIKHLLASSIYEPPLLCLIKLFDMIIEAKGGFMGNKIVKLKFITRPVPSAGPHSIGLELFLISLKEIFCHSW